MITAALILVLSICAVAESRRVDRREKQLLSLAAKLGYELKKEGEPL